MSVIHLDQESEQGKAWEAAASVPDPEVPCVTVAYPGILRSVDHLDGAQDAEGGDRDVGHFRVLDRRGGFACRALFAFLLSRDDAVCAFPAHARLSALAVASSSTPLSAH